MYFTCFSQRKETLSPNNKGIPLWCFSSWANTSAVGTVQRNELVGAILYCRKWRFCWRLGYKKASVTVIPLGCLSLFSISDTWQLQYSTCILVLMCLNLKMGNSCVIKNNTARLLIKPSFLNLKSLKDVLLNLPGSETSTKVLTLALTVSPPTLPSCSLSNISKY